MYYSCVQNRGLQRVRSTCTCTCVMHYCILQTCKVHCSNEVCLGLHYKLHCLQFTKSNYLEINNKFSSFFLFSISTPPPPIPPFTSRHYFLLLFSLSSVFVGFISPMDCTCTCTSWLFLFWICKKYIYFDNLFLRLLKSHCTLSLQMYIQCSTVLYIFWNLLVLTGWTKKILKIKIFFFFFFFFLVSFEYMIHWLWELHVFS